MPLFNFNEWAMMGMNERKTAPVWRLKNSLLHRGNYLFQVANQSSITYFPLYTFALIDQI